MFAPMFWTLWYWLMTPWKPHPLPSFTIIFLLVFMVLESCSDMVLLVAVKVNGERWQKAVFSLTDQFWQLNRGYIRDVITAIRTYMARWLAQLHWAFPKEPLDGEQFVFMHVSKVVQISRYRTVICVGNLTSLFWQNLPVRYSHAFLFYGGGSLKK